MKALVLVFLVFLACSRPQPVNPETGGPLVENIEELSHEEKLALQEEMLKRQERERTKQQEEYLRIKQQEHYNILSERFKD